MFLTAPNFELEYVKVMDPPHKFIIRLGLFLVEKDFYKIFVLPPPFLRVGVLLSYIHLLCHKGLTRMLADLQSYYFASMNTVRKNLPSVAILISLQIKGTAKNGVQHPFTHLKKLPMGLAEKLNTLN